jgi:hypothetical protein
MQLAWALARHAKAALLRLRQAENLAELTGTGPDASEAGLPEAACSVPLAAPGRRPHAGPDRRSSR